MTWLKRLLCRIVGHKWQERNPKTQLESNQAQWWLECRICHRRIMAAQLRDFLNAAMEPLPRQRIENDQDGTP